MEDSKLTQEIAKLNRSITKLNKTRSLSYSFLIGIVTGLGSVLGATLVLGLILYILRNVEFLPIIGSWIAELNKYIESSQTF
jgi:uncharacterized membrane protein YhiD involved in acid resistance